MRAMTINLYTNVPSAASVELSISVAPSSRCVSWADKDSAGRGKEAAADEDRRLVEWIFLPRTGEINEQMSLCTLQLLNYF